MDGVSSRPPLAARDAALQRLGLPLNAALSESRALDATELDVLRKVRDSLDARDVDGLSEAWRARLVRGHFSHAVGCEAVRLEHTIGAFQTIAEWRRLHCGRPDVCTIRARRRVAPHVCMEVGGEDLYGHVVWVERLCDIATLLKAGLNLDDVLRARAELTEAIERRKAAVSAEMGTLRYQQVYILDVASLSLAPLLTDRRARRLAEAVLAFGSRYYPEGTYKIFIVNAPAVFQSVFALLKPMMSLSTKSKVTVLGEDHLRHLEAQGIPRSSVPAMLGGAHSGVPALSLVRAYDCEDVWDDDSDGGGDARQFDGADGSTDARDRRSVASSFAELCADDFAHFLCDSPQRRSHGWRPPPPPILLRASGAHSRLRCSGPFADCFTAF
ncbi:CRAL-TRIO domain-containing protein [Pelagophyceae sp. CCMP2097]|nr:CRAL-TRIO domain-containing protein [Pelagophyceae sp. CCMP2097]